MTRAPDRPAHRCPWSLAAAAAPPTAQHFLLLAFGISLAVSRENIEGSHQVWLVELLGRLERTTVQLDRLVQSSRREVARKGIRQTERGSKTSAKQRRTEDVERHVGTNAEVGRDVKGSRLTAQIRLQLEDMLRKATGGRPSGKVTVSLGTISRTVSVTKGTATVTLTGLPTGKQKFQVDYRGASSTADARRTVSAMIT